jgi:integrase
MKAFPSFGAAKAHGEALKKELAKGSVATMLTPGQAADALAALERLQRHFVATGKRITLSESAAGFCDALARLGEHSLGDAIDGFLRNTAAVKRKSLADAVEEFIKDRHANTVAQEGKRPRLSTEQHSLTSIWLKEFRDTFPATDVCDLNKEHMNAYMAKHSKLAPKTRNERRNIVRMLLNWCVKQDYLTRTHRLFEASKMENETADPETIELFTAKELRAMLDRASRAPVPPERGKDEEVDFRPLLPVLALAGLAGMRFKEIIRLEWQDVFSIPGNIEVKAHKAKTRSRRLIPICSALAGWLEPYRAQVGNVWPKGYDMLHEDFGALRKELGIGDRRNGLRHAFISAHFAAHSNEGLTASMAGNSPDMIHKHYKGLLTNEQGDAWFSVAPAKPENVILLAAKEARQ